MKYLFLLLFMIIFTSCKKEETPEEIKGPELINEGWEKLNIELNTTSGTSINSIYFFTDDIGFASSHIQLFKTVDGGKTWSSVYYAPIKQIFTLYQGDSVFVASCQGMHKMKYTDKVFPLAVGESFSFYYLLEFTKTVNNVFYLKGYDDKDYSTYTSVDYGTTWTRGTYKHDPGEDCNGSCRSGIYTINLSSTSSMWINNNDMRGGYVTTITEQNNSETRVTFSQQSNFLRCYTIHNGFVYVGGSANNDKCMYRKKFF